MTARDATWRGTLLRLANWQILPALVFLALSYSTPSPNAYVRFIGLAATFIGAVAWIVELGKRLSGEGSAVIPVTWLRMVPPLFIAISLLVAADVPLRARWAISEASFEDAARTARRAGACKGTLQAYDFDRVGWYRAACVRVVGESVLFSTGMDGLGGQAGFAYVPRELDPELVGCRSFDHLGGHWYTWSAPLSC
jgi:hypothetical protein